MIDERARPLLDLIVLHESAHSVERQNVASPYDVVWNGIVRTDRPRKPLTAMWVNEVLLWQDSIDKRYSSEAAGAYQILEDTLRGLVKNGAASLDDLFDKATQDKLGFALLKGRGWEDFIAGILTPEAYANSLAKEWASLPVVTGPKKGLSYYDGDGLNRASCKPAEILKCLRSIIEPKKEPPVKYVGFEKAWAAIANVPATALGGILIWWGIAKAGLLEAAPPEELVIGAILGLSAQAYSAIKVYATPSPTYNREPGQRPVLPEAVPQPEPQLNWPLRRTG